MAGTAKTAKTAKTTTIARTRATKPRWVAAGAVGIIAAATLAGCSSDDAGGSNNGGPKIVASTSVYGSIAEAVAEDKGTVESVIDDSSADPHSYEASPADAAKIVGADLIVYNGAGYDAFVDQARENASEVPAVEGVDAYTEATGTKVEAHNHDHGGDEHDGHDHGADSHAEDPHAADSPGGDADAHDGEGHDHSGSDASAGTTDNEHVWYSYPGVKRLALDIAAQLGEMRPNDAAYYEKNAEDFGARVDTLSARITDAASSDHVHFAQTEPIGGHLFDDVDAHDVTPSGFTSSIEEGSDPSAADFAAMQDVAGKKDEIAFLILNPQTETPAIEQIADAARSAGTPLVELTETLPEGKDYVSWMDDNTVAIAKALGGKVEPSAAGAPAAGTTGRG
ncbi:metal ABC transporter solute-binding protein, Zn/Mn family [Dietzia sp.]|uniref:metal ABC transporter solute-binding protein, Zn/Mn family n=1 Tax=Dietzia sp. TaxID=1871616 RepID=UPI002FD8DBD9